MSNDEFEPPEEQSFAGHVATWVLENRTQVTISIGVIIFLGMVFAILIAPEDVYTVQGEITRIEETGYMVNVVTVQQSAPVGERIINPLFITTGLCHLDLEFGREHCRVGAKVELTRLKNTFREWWYLNALIKHYDKDYQYVIEEA